MNKIIKDNEVYILKKLAEKVAEISARPIQKERINLWKAMNGLKPERPLVVVYPERAWDELVPEKELVCINPQLRWWELTLRRQIFHSEMIDDDRPIHGNILIPWQIDWGNIGVEIEAVHAAGHGNEAIRWEPPIKTEKDLEKLRYRNIYIDREKTYQIESLANEIFDNLLNVQIYGGIPFWSTGLSKLTQLRGLEQSMIDMYENPKILHSIMSFLCKDRMRVMDQLEEENVLSVNNLTPIEYFIGSGHEGYCDELPMDDFKKHARWKDMWGLGEMQEFSGVGPEHFNEFSLQYQLPILNRFGLTSYGCCEPLDKMYQILKKNIPNLRRLSVTSPYADKKTAADNLEDNLIYAWKPNPTPLATSGVDWDWIEKDISETLDIANGCCLEIVMKSTETFNFDVARPGKWVKTVRAEIEKSTSI